MPLCYKVVQALYNLISTQLIILAILMYTPYYMHRFRLTLPLVYPVKMDTLDMSLEDVVLNPLKELQLPFYLTMPTTWRKLSGLWWVST